MTANPEEIEASLQAGLSALMHQAGNVDGLYLDLQIPTPPKKEEIIVHVIDSLDDEDTTEEACALAILQGIETLQGLEGQARIESQKQYGSLLGTIRWVKAFARLRWRTRNDLWEKLKEAWQQHLQISQAMKAIGRQNNRAEMRRMLIQKLTWEASKEKTPIGYAKLIILAQKIKAQP